MSEITRGMEIKDGRLIVTLTKLEAKTIANALGWQISENEMPDPTPRQQEAIERARLLQVSFEQAVELME